MAVAPLELMMFIVNPPLDLGPAVWLAMMHAIAAIAMTYALMSIGHVRGLMDINRALHPSQHLITCRADNQGATQ